MMLPEPHKLSCFDKRKKCDYKSWTYFFTVHRRVDIEQQACPSQVLHLFCFLTTRGTKVT